MMDNAMKEPVDADFEQSQFDGVDLEDLEPEVAAAESIVRRDRARIQAQHEARASRYLWCALQLKLRIEEAKTAAWLVKDIRDEMRRIESAEARMRAEGWLYVQV
jgi:hypothetical protein